MAIYRNAVAQKNHDARKAAAADRRETIERILKSNNLKDISEDEIRRMLEFAYAAGKDAR